MKATEYRLRDHLGAIRISSPRSERGSVLFGWSGIPGCGRQVHQNRLFIQADSLWRGFAPTHHHSVLGTLPLWTKPSRES